MYSPFQLIKKYIAYQLKAANGKGHGIHSPFVFDFVTHVLQNKKQPNYFQDIEKRRKELLNDNTIIEVEDFGAGSSVIKTNKRIIKKIAASSLKPKKYAQLLNRIVAYYQPKTIVELGSSFGVTTSYLACTNVESKIYTCEGSKAIATVAQQTFSSLHLKNIELIQGDFNKTLLPLLNRLTKIDFAFIDGNHRKQPTLNYFTQLLNFTTPSSILIFDDIHWSNEMEEAWAEIKKHEAVSLSIDLFFIGLVFLNQDFKQKQHFTIRY